MLDSEPPLTPISEPASPMPKPKSPIGTAPGSSVAEIPAVAGEQKFGGDEARRSPRSQLEHRRPARTPRSRAPQATPRTAGNRPSRITPGITEAFGAVREIGAERGRHDDGERGADAKLHAHVFRHAEHAKHLVEHRHDDRAAADRRTARRECR